MVPKYTKNGYVLVKSENGNRKNFEMTILLGTVTSNSPELGRLSMNVSDEASKRVYRATVEYVSMAITQRVVPITTTPVSAALRTRNKLVHVKS